MLVTVSPEKEQSSYPRLGRNNSLFLSYSHLGKLQHGRASTPPADTQESLGLIFSPNRKSAEYLLGELAAGGLLIQLRLCKPMAEERVRGSEERGGGGLGHPYACQCSDVQCFCWKAVGQKLSRRREGRVEHLEMAESVGARGSPKSEHWFLASSYSVTQE